MILRFDSLTIKRACLAAALFATPTHAAPAPAAATAEQPVPKLPPISPKAGLIIGRAVTEDARPVPEFTVAYSGFEDGKLANVSAGGRITETISNTIKGTKGRYEVKVPPGAYRVSAYVTHKYKDRVYNFDLESINLPDKFDYPGLRLSKLERGLIRDFALRMTSKKAGASESTETVYKHAYYGGRVDFDADQQEGILGGGNKMTPALRDAFPAGSRVTVTFEPNGPMVDGSKGSKVVSQVSLAEAGTWKFNQRGIFPGTYTASAEVTTPDGKVVPILVSLTPAKTLLKGAGNYDKVVVNWQPTVLVDFLPNDLGPVPRFGVKPVRLYLGK